MLAKPKRLNLKKEFKWVASGKRVDLKHTTFFIKKGENSFPRVGIALSGKHFKKATERNRARRLTSVALEHLYEKLPNNINIVALPKLGVLAVESKDLIQEYEEIINQLH